MGNRLPFGFTRTNHFQCKQEAPPQPIPTRDAKVAPHCSAAAVTPEKCLLFSSKTSLFRGNYTQPVCGKPRRAWGGCSPCPPLQTYPIPPACSTLSNTQGTFSLELSLLQAVRSRAAPPGSSTHRPALSPPPCCINSTVQRSYPWSTLLCEALPGPRTAARTGLGHTMGS